MMGSGKTTVGEQVASVLGRSFIDTDLLIASVSANSILDLWKKRAGRNRSVNWTAR